MEEQTRPEEISPEDWLATPPGVRAFILSLLPLREQVNLLAARLNQTSQNSSKPPSSDPPSAPPKPAKTSRGKPRKQGAQAGHPPHERPLLPEAQVQHLVAVRPSCCPQCHEPLADSLRPVVLPQRLQVWELPEVEPVVTEYQLHTLCCPGCGDLVTAQRPPDIPPGAFGPRVVARIALLHGRDRISNRELVSLLEMVWHLPISLGSVVGLQQVVAAALVAPQAEVEQAIQRAERVNADETSWREGRIKPWLWVAVSGLATLFLIQYGRGKKQLASLLGEQFGGIVGSDRYCAYNGLDPKRRQLCWAHLVRNLRGRADAKGPWQEAAREMERLAEEVLVVWAMYREGALSRPVMEGLLQALQQALWERVEAGTRLPNTLGSLCCDLAPRWEALWTFLRVEGVEPTNNAAERALRPAVLWRKGCFGTQSEEGSRFVERMLTVSATCQQNNRPLLPFLVEAISAHWAGRPAPALLPSP